MKLRICLGVLIVFFHVHLFAQSLSEKIPFDKNTIVGKLPNGLTYYIRKNTRPENKAELRLVVNAGSVLERDDQRGIAHFLEHMAFNGTKNFPKNELLNYLQKSGVRFGADLNATTNTDYTLYMLPISTSDPVILQNGYQVIRDWAGNLLLDEEEINKERGIILEEKRMRQNAFMRTYAKYLPVLVNGSKYGDRLPIGQEEIIKNAPRKTFVDFYRDWYRPNNMAVIVVGDIDIKETEIKIKSLFSDLQNPKNAPLRPNIIPINWHAMNKAYILSDPENTLNFLSLYIGLSKVKEDETWNEYANDVMNEVVATIINNRLQENAMNPKSPVTYGGIDFKEELFKGYSSLSVGGIVKNDVKASVKYLVAEVLKAKKFGFTAAELDRVKKNLTKRYEELFLEKDKTESANYVNEYVEHFLKKVSSPGIEAENKFVKSFLKDLTLVKVNYFVKKISLDKPAFVLYNAKEPIANPITEKELLVAYEEAKKQKVIAVSERVVATKLLDKEPQSGTIVSTQTNEKFDSKTLKFSNGITVIYKNTSFKNDELFMKGSIWGGVTSLTNEEAKLSKCFNLINSLGVGKIKAVDLPKIFSGKQIYANLNIGASQVQLFGMASANDIETFMQLLYLKLTGVNFDTEEFDGVKNNMAVNIGGIINNPSFKFNDSLNKFKYNFNERLFGFPTESELKAASMDKLKALYQKITGNLNGLVLVFSGSINEQKFTELVQKYIASIPTSSQVETLHTVNILKPITGKNNFLIKAGKENKSEINFSFYGDLVESDFKEMQVLSLLGDILQMEATEKLREEMGSTYSPKVSTSLLPAPLSNFALTLTVSSLPENADKIITAYKDLVIRFIQQGTNDDYLQKAKAQKLKTLETNFKSNFYWTNILEQEFMYAYDIPSPEKYNQLIEAISKEDLKTVAKKYLMNANVLYGLINPE